MSSYTLIPVLVLGLILLSATPAAAFGSGSLGETSGLYGRNFLHGDVEGVLTQLAKTAGGAGAAGIIGAIFSGGKSSGKKFTEDDVKRVYFGNWLRDLSQAVDVAALKLLPAARIVNVVAVLGFLEFGYATREFEVTPERLGNYLTVEHIDNPTGYPDDKGSDPREVANYPHLRGPLDPRELEINDRTGMKKYIATEGEGFDTAARFIKDNLVRAIELGRSGKHNERDEWESLRLLGTALHTLEDFAAHSNFLEVALQKLGYDRVFTHVGDQVRVRAPSGREVAPIVTGSFGGADFMHSMLGTADDKLSSSSTHDVSAKFNDNKGKDGGALRTVLKLLLDKDDKKDDDGRTETQKNPDQQVDRLEDLRRRAQELSGVDVSEEEVHRFLMDTLTIHDDIRRTISGIIDRIPGLDELLGEVSNNLAVFVFSTLEPVMSPIFKTVTDTLFEASAAVVDNHDQTIVFNDERASDPTHSMLAKDHFNNILNAPAGRVAQIIVRHTVQQVVEAWDDDGIDPRRVAESAITALHHPDFVERPNAVQEEMLRFVDTWINSHGNEKDEVLRRLEKESVLHHRNNTDGISGGNTIAAADANINKYSAASQGLAGLVKPGGVLADAPGADVVSGVLGALSLDGGNKQQQHGQQQQQHGGQQYGGGGQQHHQQQQQQQQQHYGGGGRQDDDRFGRNKNDDNNRYGQSQSQYGGQQSFGGGRQEHQQSSQYSSGGGGGGYGGGRRNDDDDNENRYGGSGGGRRNDNDDEGRRYGSGGNSGGYGGRREEQQQEYGGGRQESYGGGRQEYGGGGRDEYGSSGRQESCGGGRQEYGGGGRDEYGSSGRQHESSYNSGGGSYGGRRNDDDDGERRQQYGGGGRNDDDNEYGGGNRRHQENEGYGGGGGGGYGRRDDDEGGEYGRRQGGGGRRDEYGY